MVTLTLGTAKLSQTSSRTGIALPVFRQQTHSKAGCLQVLFGVNQRLRVEDVDSPLVQVRPVKRVLLAVVTGDRGLCGGYNNQVIKKVHELITVQLSVVMNSGLNASCSFVSYACSVSRTHVTSPTSSSVSWPRCHQTQVFVYAIGHAS